MFFKLKTKYSLTLFTLLAVLPFAVQYIFHSEKLYRFLFDWLGVFDTISAVPLFLATGNFIVAARLKNKRLIPMMAAFVAFWAFLSETSWGMDYTSVVNVELIRYAGFMPYVQCITDLAIYSGVIYMFVLLIGSRIPVIWKKLLKMGWPTPSAGLYICMIPMIFSLLFTGKIPYTGDISKEMPEFISGLWIFLLSAEYGLDRE